jgi:hypothetical protein
VDLLAGYAHLQLAEARVAPLHAASATSWWPSALRRLRWLAARVSSNDHDLWSSRLSCQGLIEEISLGARTYLYLRGTDAMVLNGRLQVLLALEDVTNALSLVLMLQFLLLMASGLSLLNTAALLLPVLIPESSMIN